VNAKEFYLLLYSIAFRTIQLSTFDMHLYSDLFNLPGSWHILVLLAV